MKIRLYIWTPILLSLSAALLTGCDDGDAHTANKFAQKIITTTKNAPKTIREKISETSEELEMPSLEMPDFDISSEALDEKIDAIAERTAEATATKISDKLIERGSETFEETSEGIEDSTESVRSAYQSGKSSVAYYVDKLPRSEREAQQAVQRNGGPLIEQIREMLSARAIRPIQSAGNSRSRGGKSRARLRTAGRK